jgi:dTDP-4-amino-4,6-dideoxygalactose transaminase
VIKPTRLTIWPTLPPTAYRRPPLPRLPFPLEEPNHRVFARARHGLWHGVRAIGLRRGDVVLAPAYHHGSEIESLERAGLVCRFYDAEADLQPSEDRLEALLGPEVRVLYLIHYFGMPQDAGRWRAWCDLHRLVLIEDAAMAFLSASNARPVGSFGDLSIFCLYKTFGVPDGGAVFCTAPGLPWPRHTPSLGLVPSALRHGSWLAQRSRVFSTLHSIAGGDSEPRWGKDFALGDPDTAPSRMTTALLPRLADDAAAVRRRSNHAVLLDRLGDRVDAMFPAISDGASPVAFLMRMDPERQRIARRILGDLGVVLANFWMVPHPSVPDVGLDRARSLRSSVVGLPVHQELRDQDLERIVTGMRRAEPGARRQR